MRQHHSLLRRRTSRLTCSTHACANCGSPGSMPVSCRVSYGKATGASSAPISATRRKPASISPGSSVASCRLRRSSSSCSASPCVIGCSSASASPATGRENVILQCELYGASHTAAVARTSGVDRCVAVSRIHRPAGGHSIGRPAATAGDRARDRAPARGPVHRRAHDRPGSPEPREPVGARTSAAGIRNDDLSHLLTHARSCRRSTRAVSRRFRIPRRIIPVRLDQVRAAGAKGHSATDPSMGQLPYGPEASSDTYSRQPRRRSETPET
jgi:hypothetical protein